MEPAGSYDAAMIDTEWLRRTANMINLSTPLGPCLAAATGANVDHGPQGLTFASGYRPKFPAAAAFTVGNVVFFRQDTLGLYAPPPLIGHEARDSTQYAFCLGLPFLPLYAAAALWSLWRTGDPASRNFFERNAELPAGGYIERPAVRGILLRRTRTVRP